MPWTSFRNFFFFFFFFFVFLIEFSDDFSTRLKLALYLSDFEGRMARYCRNELNSTVVALESRWPITVPM